jgi:hypothetical protein
MHKKSLKAGDGPGSTPKHAVNIPWSKNLDWTSKLVSAILNDDKICYGLFSTTVEKQKVNHLNTNGTHKTDYHGMLAESIFKDDLKFSNEYTEDPTCFVSSVGSHLDMQASVAVLYDVVP